MKMRKVFGFLFFLLSAVFCAMQLVSLFGPDSLTGSRIVTGFSLTTATLLLGLLVIRGARRILLVAMSGISFVVCLASLAGAGVLAMKSDETVLAVYVVCLAYAGLYALFGIALSFLASEISKGGATQ